MINEDMLEKLFEKQEILQRRLNNDITTQEYKNIMILALMDELTEALRETPWKPWKKNQEYNEEKFQNELIDAWHFLINLSLSSGMDATMVYMKFLEKNKENHNRQDRMY